MFPINATTTRAIAQPVARFVGPAIQQGMKDAVRGGTAVIVLYAGLAAVALVGYGAWLGGSAAYRGGRHAYSWLGNTLARDILAMPETTNAEPRTGPTLNGTAEEVPA